MEIKIKVTPEKKYKGFNETFKLCAFSLAFAFLYPNRATAVKRAIIITLIITFCGGQLFWFITYTFKCLYTLDIYNFARNMTLAVVLVLFFIKTYYVIYATSKFGPLLDKISEDLLKANNLEEDYRKLYDDHIKIAKVGEISWLLIPTILSALFPLYAGTLMSIESIQTDDYERRMVHDMELLFVEDIQSESPFFQCMFAYNCIQCVVLVPNYCGFDGSFCIATTHLRLKLKLMALKVEKAFMHSNTRKELRLKMCEAIRDHQDAIDFHVQLQNVYGPWLFAVFMLTSFMISFNVYQIYLLKRIDPKYTSFGVVGILHIYLPCYYATALKKFFTIFTHVFIILNHIVYCFGKKMEIKSDVGPEKKYKGFNETFKLCAFSLAFAFLYPNRTTAVKRAIIITLIVTFCGGQLFWFITYTFKCLYTLDIYNFARNMTLAVVLVLFFFKTYYVIYATSKFAPLLDKISEDLLKANDLEEEYQKLYDEHIKIAQFGETYWLVIPTLMSALFPLYAGTIMSIESIQTDDYERRMVHDMELLFVEHIQSESPFFQAMFAYNCVQCVVLVPNYCGFDGSFCIATTHLRLKLKLMALKVEKAFMHSKTCKELRLKICEAIRDHQDALDFYVQLQNVYGPWLFAVFMLTSFMISFNLYQIYLLKRIDPKYTSFGMFGIMHIYFPCHYSSALTKISEEIPDDLYVVSWEAWADPVVTKLLIFMITKAQEDMIVTGMGLVVFNMQLFKSILQTSYSFFTLITA